MKVFYELSALDVKDIIAEKYGVDIEKVDLKAVSLDNTYVRIDMSATETPGQMLAPGKSFKPIVDEVEDDELYAAPISDEPSAQKEQTDPAKSDDPEVRYSAITDEVLASKLASGSGVAEILRCYDLSGKKYDKFYQRLYKRAEKYRTECAS